MGWGMCAGTIWCIDNSPRPSVDNRNSCMEVDGVIHSMHKRADLAQYLEVAASCCRVGGLLHR
jgi:hypothetical protein